MSAHQAYIVAAMGASGSGKSAFIKQCLAAGAPRLLIWDVMDEYGQFAKRAPSLTVMVNHVKRNGDFSLRYVPEGTPDQLAARFDVFCSLAFTLGNLTMVVEELQTVTKPSWAPSGWSNCTLRGRHRGLRIFGVSQRPASVDKNFFSNATLVRCGRLNYDDDVRVMDRVLRLPSGDIRTVGDLKPLEYVQRTMDTGEVSAGVLTFDAPPKKNRARGASKSAAQ